MSAVLRVAVTDLQTGETETTEVADDDYFLICTGRRYLANAQTHRNGTHVLTIKKDSA